MKDGMTNGCHDHKKDSQLAMFQVERNSWGGGFVCRFLWHTGAGIIGGWTAYIAFKSGSNRWAVNHRGARRKLVEFGITRNANRVPYASR